MQSETSFHALVLRSEHDEIRVGCFSEQFKIFLTFTHSSYQLMNETLYVPAEGERLMDCEQNFEFPEEE